jgi:tRNA threonylcarbamoyladenosine modification (KEOPS) complex Cgi121 subunit
VKNFCDFGFFAELTGFRHVKFSEAEAFLQNARKESAQGVEVQFFNPLLVASREHLDFAVLNALETFRNKTNISKSLAVEIMLYASAQRQIKKAIDFIGIKPGCSNLAVVIAGKSAAEVEGFLKKISCVLNSEPDGSVLELTNEKIPIIKKAYKITDKMLNAIASMDEKQGIVDLIIERAALLSVQV